MKIGVAVGGVDGVSDYGYESRLEEPHVIAATALRFLETVDHEGSVVSLRVECDDTELAYHLLREIRNWGEMRRRT